MLTHLQKDIPHLILINCIRIRYFAIMTLYENMINIFLNYFSNRKKIKKHTLLGKKIEIRFIAPDIVENNINKILVVFTNSKNLSKSYYNIPSLIFLDIDYWDIEHKSTISIYSDFPELIDVKMYIENFETMLEKYNIDVLRVNIELIREHLIPNLTSSNFSASNIEIAN